MTKFLPDERFLPQAVMLTAAATNEILISSYKLEHTMRQRGDALRVLFEGWAGVAMEQNGSVFVYAEKPECDDVGWYGRTACLIPSLTDCMPRDQWRESWIPLKEEA
jgi:hypothetical protein